MYRLKLQIKFCNIPMSTPDHRSMHKQYHIYRANYFVDKNFADIYGTSKIIDP